MILPSCAASDDVHGSPTEPCCRLDVLPQLASRINNTVEAQAAATAAAAAASVSVSRTLTAQGACLSRTSMVIQLQSREESEHVLLDSGHMLA
jgi:hypothetical protein